MSVSDWSSDVCSSDLLVTRLKMRQIHQCRIEDQSLRIADLGDRFDHVVKLCFTPNLVNSGRAQSPLPSPIRTGLVASFSKVPPICCCSRGLSNRWPCLWRNCRRCSSRLRDAAKTHRSRRRAFQRLESRTKATVYAAPQRASTMAMVDPRDITGGRSGNGVRKRGQGTISDFEWLQSATFIFA